ncbi:helix-turn-helix domain-containing protein [Domibacillus robiginosus]|uniref:helix-turn-helix domain-containing protein n=1 Tax=Domibacillus robiginosus TaxID=1071054 RepID=UPI00067C0E26|nr:AraC family transcriptional regulator [Domibacillus robiginosus]
MKIYVCGYAYHTQRLYGQHKPGFCEYVFRLQTEGTCEAKVNGHMYTIKQGDLLMIHPDDHYELFIKENQESGDYYLVGNGSWLAKWWERSPKPVWSHIGVDENLISLWRSIIIEERRPASSKSEELSLSLVQSLCFYIERAVRETSIELTRPYAVTRMMRYIEEHALGAFKVADVALHAGLSVSRSIQLFKSSTGKTMLEYAHEIRLSSAINRMTYTTMTLEHIAEECGFGSYPYFHKVFKKKYGTAPGVWRTKF